MPSLYNCRHDGDQYRVTKFDSDFNVEASYLCTLSACECPAGHRPTCRHRQMLPKFIQRNHIGDEWFWDHDRGGWVQGTGMTDDQASEMLKQSNPYADEVLRQLEEDRTLQQEPDLPPYDAFDYSKRSEIAPSRSHEAKMLTQGLMYGTGKPIDEDEVELIEPSAIMGDGSPYMGGVNARVIEPSPKPSSPPTIRRRV